MRRLMASLAILFLLTICAGCAGQRSAFPAYPTGGEALGEVLGKQVSILYTEPFDDKRDLVLFQADESGPSATLLARTGFGKWRMTDAVFLHGSLWRLGALSYSRENLGYVEERDGTSRRVSAETHIVYGEVLDPAITWVELILDREGAEPVRANVANGYWVARLPAEHANTWFELKAGDDSGVRFIASVARGVRYSYKAPDQAPLVEYRDRHQGIQLQHPITASIPVVEDNRLTITISSSLAISVEQRPELHGMSLEELLQREVASGGDRLLESGIRPLGVHEAAYLLEAVQDEEAKGTTYYARYLTAVEDAGYEVACTARWVLTRDSWESRMKPFCDLVLETVRLGSAAGQG